MTDAELLQAISSKIDTKLEPIKTEISGMNMEINDLKIQVEQTERVLKNEIRKSEYFILDEVEKVHNLLDKHQNNKTKHIA